MNSSAVPASNPIISAHEVCRRFKDKLALDHVSLELVPGRVFGLVGANGAGKTTLLKHILGLLKPSSGWVKVFGLDPVLHPVEVLGKIGFLSEDRDLPPWMRIGELLRYAAAFHPGWDAKYAEDLRSQFQLDALAQVKHLSRGERAKAGLLIALAHRPPLLVLDEPSSGLDPIVRREMLEAIVRSVADEGRTVLFSSHLLDEIERVSDDIAIMAQGRLLLSGGLADILESHHCLTVRFDTSPTQTPAFAGALSIQGQGREWTILCNGARSEAVEAARKLGGSVVDEKTATLEEIFLARLSTSAQPAHPTPSSV